MKTFFCISVYRKENILNLWEYLLELLRGRRARLELNVELQQMFQEMGSLVDWMEEMKVIDINEDQNFLLISNHGSANE